jgi:hypothetical protein
MLRRADNHLRYCHAMRALERFPQQGVDLPAMPARCQVIRCIFPSFLAVTLVPNGRKIPLIQHRELEGLAIPFEASGIRTHGKRRRDILAARTPSGQPDK